MSNTGKARRLVPYPDKWSEAAIKREARRITRQAVEDLHKLCKDVGQQPSLGWYCFMIGLVSCDYRLGRRAPRAWAHGLERRICTEYAQMMLEDYIATQAAILTLGDMGAPGAAG